MNVNHLGPTTYSWKASDHTGLHAAARGRAGWRALQAGTRQMRSQAEARSYDGVWQDAMVCSGSESTE